MGDQPTMLNRFVLDGFIARFSAWCRNFTLGGPWKHLDARRRRYMFLLAEIAVEEYQMSQCRLKWTTLRNTDSDCDQLAERWGFFEHESRSSRCSWFWHSNLSLQMRGQHMLIYAETLEKLQADHFSAKYHELEARVGTAASSIRGSSVCIYVI